LIEKKLPGKGWEYMVYNKLNQLVARQDGNMRMGLPSPIGGWIVNGWIFYKYDVFGREVLKGFYQPGSTSTRLTVQTEVDGQSVLWETKNSSVAVTGYSNNAFPQANIGEYLTMNYYDNYDFPGGNPRPYTGGSNMSNGLLTAKKVNSEMGMLWTIYYYDHKSQVIKSYRDYLYGTVGGNNYIETDYTYSFTGEQTSKTEKYHKVNESQELATVETGYTYDHVGRSKEIKKKISSPKDSYTGSQIVLSKNNYNELGQLRTKGMHSEDQGQNFIHQTQYSYNERGWLKQISSPTFTETIAYQDDIQSTATANYNGNISEIRLNGEKTGANTNYFAYDKLNRLNNSWNSALPTMNETNISYDKGGNILHLERGDGTNLNYGYSGAFISSSSNFLDNLAGTIKGIGIENYYDKDQNGNLSYIEDNMGGIDAKYIYYDHNNLPLTVTGATYSEYVYDANGIKLASYTDSHNTLFAANALFNNFSSNISFIHTEEGRAVRNADGSYRYEYFIKDHLGNTRQSIDKYNNTARVIQEDNYCAFGLSVNKYNFSSDNKYLYNGKEKLFMKDVQENAQHDLEWYDYGARFYDPVIGRWNVIDPLAEMTPSQTPYHYGNNSPVVYTDPDGRYATPFGAFFAWAGNGFRGGIHRAAEGSYQDLNYGRWYVSGVKKREYNKEILAEDFILRGKKIKRPLSEAIGMAVDWVLGTGSDNRVFVNDEIANSFRDARVVNQAREYWYEKVNSGEKTIYDGLDNYLGKKVITGGNFGLSGIRAAGPDAIEQFVGSFNPEISSDGVNLTFSIQNKTSFNSLTAKVFRDWERSTFRPGGNMTQTYIFTEPINFNKIKRFK
jgi:RHS repeat-associated protein